MMNRRRFLAASALLGLCVFASTRADTVLNPERAQGLAAPAAPGMHTLVTLKGPGKFVAAQITKQGGATGLSFVSLDIDGKNLINASFLALKNWALTQNNPYGVVILSTGGIDDVTIGYPSTLTYNKTLTLSVDVKEAGVVQIIGNVVHGQ